MKHQKFNEIFPYTYFIYAGIVDFCKSQGIDFKCVRNWAFGRTKSKSGWYVKILNGQGLTVLDE
jgi:hypothetical protein